MIRGGLPVFPTSRIALPPRRNRALTTKGAT